MFYIEFFKDGRGTHWLNFSKMTGYGNSGSIKYIHFPTMFSDGFLFRDINTWDCSSKGYNFTKQENFNPFLSTPFLDNPKFKEAADDN